MPFYSPLSQFGGEKRHGLEYVALLVIRPDSMCVCTVRSLAIINAKADPFAAPFRVENARRRPILPCEHLVNVYGLWWFLDSAKF